MTEQQLQQIEARTAMRDRRQWLPEQGRYTDEEFAARIGGDVAALIAEVRRLQGRIAHLEQVSGELCESCGWAFVIPGEGCANCQVRSLTGRVAELEAGREDVTEGET